MRNFLVSALIVGLIGWTALAAAGAAAQNAPAEQLRFETPREALDALLAATKAKDLPKLRAILGVEAGELGSGDEVQDRADLREFATNLAAAAKLVNEGDDKVMIQIGVNGYIFPVPVVRKDGAWFFDAEAGKEEMLNRRIGENELRTLATCRGYVAAQRDYYADDWDGDGVIEYAQRLASTPGKKDGLYWESKDDEPLSPLGPLIAEAQSQGYFKTDAPATTQPAAQPATQPAAGPRPYHGYFYKIVTRQGERAPGGKYDYVINGHMVAGFALVAWPVEYGESGVMTFVVSTNGKVYEKDLGEKTAELVAAIAEYNPDDTWAVSKD
ncbi:MAG: DUF2950 domain-containing protein [Planctomycetota bacterium]